MATKFWCKELLMIKPDPAPYLLAARKPRETRLLASPGRPLYYTNPARFEIDELSGKVLGTQAFELQFEVNSAAITQGTTQLLNVPGLVECEAVNETLYFKFAWDVSWYSLDKKYLKSGWNLVALASDGIQITLTVNEYSAVVLDSSTAYIARLVSGFGPTFKFTNAKYTPSSVNTGDIILRAMRTSTHSSRKEIFSNNVGNNPPSIGLDSSNRPTLWTSADAQSGQTAQESNIWYWFRVLIQNGTYSLYTLKDESSLYTRLTLPDISVWAHECDSTQDMLSNCKTSIGNHGDSSSTYWPGIIDVTSMKVVLNGASYYDGFTDYSQLNISGRLSYTDEWLGTPYPQLSVGQISSPVSWTKVRNIKAVIL